MTCTNPHVNPRDFSRLIHHIVLVVAIAVIASPLVLMALA